MLAVTLNRFPIPDDVDHGEAHADRVGGVVFVRGGDSADAVVAVTKDLDPHAVTLLSPENKK